MKLPNAHMAVIASSKLRDYLLNPTHRRGGTKARLLMSMGYSSDEWQRLENDLRTYHLSADVSREEDSEYGKRFEIVAALPGKGVRAVAFRSIWQIDLGANVPRLITMYPE